MTMPSPDSIQPHRTFAVDERYSVRVYKYKDTPRARKMDRSLVGVGFLQQEIYAVEDDEFLHTVGVAIRELREKESSRGVG